MTAGIYKITCVKNGKEYYGQSRNMNTRFVNHKTLLKNGRHHSRDMQSDFDKYGIDSFTFKVYEAIDKIAKRRKQELDYITDAKKRGISYNNNCVSESGNGRYITVLLTEDLYQIIRQEAKKKKQTLAAVAREAVLAALNLGAKNAK